MRFYSHKTRRNNRITLFKALDNSLWLFFCGHGFNIRPALAQVRFVTTFVLLVSILGLSTIAFSQGRNSEMSIGVSNSLNVHPGLYDTEDWYQSEQSLQLDQRDDSLFQKFNEKNSAFVPSTEKLELILEEATKAEQQKQNFEEPVQKNNLDSSSYATSSAGDADLPTVEPSETVTDVPDENSPTTEPDNTQEEQLPVAEPSPEEVSVYKRATAAVFTAFSQAFEFFPYLNATTSIPGSEILLENEPVTTPPVEFQFNQEIEESDELVTPEEESVQLSSTTVSSAESDSDLEAPVLDVSNDVVEVSSTTTQTSEDAVDIETESVVETADTKERFSITFDDFSIPSLEPGEFITGVQLRASLAARYETAASDTLPYFEFTYITPSSTQNVGAVIVDEETSNALNGGYYLFALPTIETEAELDDVSVEVSFVGDRDKIEDIFLDAVWLEIHTEKITRADLVARTEREIRKNLRQPGANEFVSDRQDFMRSESPVFNLKYVSQRSRVVQSVRDLFGYNKVRISEVEVLHGGIQPIGIKPQVNVTTDGLISFTFPDGELEKLKPGKYTVQFEVDEGGYTFSDSFDFQWGMLAINPAQTEYEVGEIVDISMGALTPNGNTLCAADLRLYVIDPNEFIHKVPVETSGLCQGNNVIDEPDYSSIFTSDVPGTHEMYLESLSENGEVISHTSNTFEVVENHQLSIERNGPTRIYPVAPYEMTLRVDSDEVFDGTLTERIPAEFKILETDARVETIGAFKELTWDVSLLSNDNVSLSYTFDAPDLSPYLYELGPAELTGTSPLKKTISVASSTPGASELPIKQNVRAGFVEHRQWQIASDATGNMILFWDNPNYIPANWSCLSCGSGTFYQRFVVGSSTYNSTGGLDTHSHTASGSVLGTVDASVSESGKVDNIAPNSHTHTLTPNIVSTSTLPAYTELRVIQYTGGTGEPTNIPAGAIAMFDVASSSLPAGWNRYSALDGRYPYGEDTPGTTAGSNDHAHDVDGTTGAAGGTAERNRPGGISAALTTHTHTISTTTPDTSIEPPYIEVLFARLTATSTSGMPNDAIAMWTEDVPTNGWTDVSSDGAAPFNNRFPKGASSYGTTGGSTSHSHSDMTGIVSSAPSATDSVRSGSPNPGSSGSHTHSVSVTSFSTESNLPPYISAVFGKKAGTDPLLNQLSYRWYGNEDAQTPTDPWSPGAGLDLSEREPITATSTPVNPGDALRLRINVEVTNATTTASTSVKLQYAEADVCSVATEWFDVGDTSSSTALWRGYNNSVSDSSALASTTLASTTVAQSYEENGVASSTVVDIGVDGVGEWDFVLEHNAATAGTNYCFRLVNGDTEFSSYSSYPQLLTNRAPNAPSLIKLFDNEKTASTTGLQFDFITSDPESEDLTYQIQIDDDYSFGSTLEDRNTISNAAQFENQTDNDDKAPFTSGHIIRFDAASTFTNGTTYYWRVRATDPNGSTEWGDWSVIYSFTIDTSLLASAWFQTTEEQFNSNELDGVEALGTDLVDIISGSSTATMISDDIVFTEGPLGSAWESFAFTDAENSGDITYTIQYLNDSDVWTDIPTGDLPGNGSIDTSPVNLLALDVDTYNTLRIVADFTDGAGAQTISDWTVNWGYLVEKPTISKLFANEKTGTTTPVFEFTTTDLQNDGLTYQVSWSTDNTFTSGTTTRTSDTHSGFENIDNGAQTSPLASFTSGDDIRFTVQGADALTDGATYWWRVRAKDPAGDDAWSFWTDVQSFTVATNTFASTWFQTTEEQFDTDILSGTIALGSDSLTVATTASEAMLVYGEGTESAPRYRTWNGSVWSSEGTMQDIAAPLRWVVLEESPTEEEYIAITLGTDSDVNAQTYSVGEWGNLQEMTVNAGVISTKGVGLAYETTSGDALVVYCNNAPDPSYRVWSSATDSWGIEQTLNIAETSNCEWIQLASDPVSDEIIALVRGTDGNPYELWVWNGSAWGNSTTFGNITDSAHEGMSIAYEESGGQAVAVSSYGNPARFRYTTWNGTAWSAAQTDSSVGNEPEWMSMVSDDGSDEMVLCYQDEDTNIGYVQWDGAAWTGQGELLTTTGKAKTDPGFACAYESSGSRDNYIMAVYTDTTQTNYAFWNNTTWSAGTQINSIGDTITSALKRTGDGTLLGLFFDETNDELLFSSWNGSTWSTTQTIETNASVDSTPYGSPYALVPRGDGTEGTAIAAPGIDFNDGSGPYWQEMSWVDTTPGTSNILYSVQYFTASSTWAFVPNSLIPGNDVGTTTGPIDLTGLNKNTYNIIRPYAELSCDGSGNCPSLQDWTVEWAEGITVSGTLQQYDQSTNVNSGTIAVAVNGVLQTGKTGVVAGGVWSIANVTVFPGDVVTVFVSDTSDSTEAVGVTRYDGVGDIGGMALFERHVSLGSYDATSTPLTNGDIGAYNFVNDEDVFLNLVSTSTLDICADAGCGDAELYIASTTVYAPGGNLITHDIEINGTLIATTTLYVSGSWDNNATTTLTGSTVVMTATSTTETIDTIGATVSSFNNLTFGTTTGNATWTLATSLDVNGNLAVDRGTLARATTPITVAGNLSTSANGFWTGYGTTTFDGSTVASWNDQNATVQNIGYAVIDGAGKAVTLGSDVSVQSVTIGANDTLDTTVGNYTITVYESWTNNNTFLPRSGEVVFAATTSTYFIDDGGDGFYDLTFNGVGGAWAFSNNTLDVGNDFAIATGTITMPSATTTIAGSFNNSGGIFQHSNADIIFTSGSAETLTLSGDSLNNAFFNAYFNGGGSWTFTEARATTTNNIIINAGTVVFPSDTISIAGSLTNNAGSINGNGGTVEMLTNTTATIETGGSSLSSLLITGSGVVTIVDVNSTLTDNLTINAGTLVFPSGTFTIGGSLVNNAILDANNGEILFNSTAGSEVINFGASSAYDITFDDTGGDWTITSHATATNDFALSEGSSFTVSAGQVLAIGNSFTNNVGGASTTWTGSTLSLYGGTYTVNAKTDAGDSYETLLISSPTGVSMWNSDATTYTVASGAYLYSMDHASVDGDLYIWGDYSRTSGSEYWSYVTDFDGTDITGSERQANVKFANGATASITNATLEILGTSGASSTIANQGAGTYEVTVSSGTTTAQYYNFADLGGNGLSLLATTKVTSLANGYFTVGGAGASSLTISSTTIDADPGKQILSVGFATTTAIAANNVAQTDGVASSYWWFRNSYGNIDGELFDNDDGNPGSIRWDDSALVLTISGNIYADDGATLMAGATCDGDANQPVTVVVENGATYTGSCTATSSYSISGVTVVGDPTLTVYLNGADGGEKAVVVTKTPTADITDLDLYENRVIVRHEDTAPMTISDMASFDNDNDSAGLTFTAATGTTDSLVLEAGNELYVWNGKTFTPGGTVTLTANATANDYDGTLHLGPNATFTGAGTTTYTVGGSIELENGATFIPASTTILMVATTSGKTIDTVSTSSLNVYELQFTGVAGGWNINGNIIAGADIQVATGTITGTGDITLTNGSFYGDGLVSLGGGITAIESTNTLGGVQAWTFGDLTLGDNINIGTTTPASTATTTILGTLTIESAHFLDAGSSLWDLTGSGSVFVETGNFLEDTSTVTYSGNVATNIISTDYYNLTLSAIGGTPTYTATGLGIQVFGNLQVGGASTTIVNFDTNDSALNVDGDVLITSNGTLVASNSGSFTIAGSYDNNGTFTASGGTVVFDSAGTETIAAGTSDFANVTLAGTGSFTVTEHATATNAFTITATSSSFTLSSGQTLAVGGTFTNALGGGSTTWSGSQLYLYGGGNYEINSKTVSDSYEILTIADSTQIRMWNSDAVAVNVSVGSLYSMDHANTAGELYVFGTYSNTSTNDYWSYATDFDGTDLGGSDRVVDVYVASGSSLIYAGTSELAIFGETGATTTIQNQGSGTFAMTIGGSASTSMNYYSYQDLDADGLTFTGSPNVDDLSYGSFLVANDSDSAVTVGGTALNSSPARTFTLNQFATTSGVTTAVNITATGTSVSSWRFTNHYGDIDGENFDVDPDGDPGYVGWDDSAALITISGQVYSNEGSTVSGVCDDSSTVIRLVVEGLTTYDASCSSATGLYSIANVSYGAGDELIVFINGTASKAATVTEDPISNINNLDLYENRIIVRHEGVDTLSIADMATYDSSNDADIQFTVSGGNLTLPSDTKLIVWTNKEFEPGGNVTIPGGGGGAAYDGTLELFNGSTWTSNASEVHTIGGSLIAGTGATYEAANSTTTFTTTGSGRTIDINDGTFYNVSFTGSGSWNITDSTFSANDLLITAGSLTFPTGTSTFSGYFNNTGGSFVSNGSEFVFDGGGTHVVAFGGSDAGNLNFTGTGSWSMTDTNATSTGGVIVTGGAVTLPSGTLSLADSFRNVSGSITHNTSEIIISTSSAATVLASSSDLYAVTFAGGGTFSFEDEDLTLLDSLTLDSGSMTLASGTMSIGGSFDASGGTFDNATGNILFNSADTGETVNPGSSAFNIVVFGSGTGGWTLASDATTTSIFSLSAASDFTLQSGSTLYVGGMFNNSLLNPVTTWDGTTLILDSGTSFEINATSTGDSYETLVIGADMDISAWNSEATTTIVASDSSFYSQDHGAVDGSLYIYGDFHVSTTTEWWSYATDFNGDNLALGSNERPVSVYIASGATTTVDGGTLNIVGASGNETTISNQGSGQYAFAVNDGTFNAQYYAFRNLNSTGLNLSGTPIISTLSYGDFELAVNGGRLINLSSTTLNYNASLILLGNRFATTTSITGTNVYLTGTTSNAWTFVSHTGNLDGESFDLDGGSLCGSVRWDDSDCLITQQTHYRWRNDDGGLGVPDSEWYDSNWSKRKAVRIDNNDATSYTDAVVEVTVLYDSDMQIDFDDLRFTDDTGTNTIPYFIASTTNSASAEVWVKVADLPAAETADVYMYYGNATATSSSSSTLTFIAADDFEDNNITEYSGANDDKSLFSVTGSHPYGNSSYGLDNSGDSGADANDGGIARFDQNFGRSSSTLGVTVRYMQYIDTTGGDDEVCTMFAVQSPVSNNENYAVCIEQIIGSDYISLTEDVVDTDVYSGTNLASTTVTYSDGWYEIEVDWETDGDITVTLYDDYESQVAQISATDSTYTNGGHGFTYWGNEGGWDNFSVRPLLTTEPTVRFGAESIDGGATWGDEQDTAFGTAPNVTSRLRLAIENSGLQVTGQNFDLEFAPKGAAPSCESISSGNYVSVPNQASCGSSPICMQTTSNYVDGAATTDLLEGADGTFSAGKAVESPSNTTGNITINQDFYTELEYAITATTNATSSNYCLRVTESGTELDSYLRVAELVIRFDPTFGTVNFNNGQNISLLPGTTTRVYATSTVTDLNGYTDIVAASSTMFTTSATAACAADNNDCYIETLASSCSLTGCSGNSCVLECYSDFYFHTDATFSDGGEFWQAFLEAEDNQGGVGFNTSPSIDVFELTALDVDSAIDYGSLYASSTTGTYNPTTTVQNLGNVPIDINLDGTDLTDGGTSEISVDNQLFATTTFDYDSCPLGTTCTQLSTTTITNYELDLTKPTSTTPAVEDYVYWGIQIPFGAASNPHSGVNTFYAVTD